MILNIRIDLGRQSLALLDGGREIRRYAVSTAANGAGEKNGSQCTPRGRHLIRAKIGAGQPSGTVFVARRPTGEIFVPEFKTQYPQRDWILTRILWLSCLEHGKNRLGDVDTMRRYIYLHGTPDETELGKPGSHGCVRMANPDIIELFNLVPAYTEVQIDE